MACHGNRVWLCRSWVIRLRPRSSISRGGLGLGGTLVEVPRIIYTPEYIVSPAPKRRLLCIANTPKHAQKMEKVIEDLVDTTNSTSYTNITPDLHNPKVITPELCAALLSNTLPSRRILISVSGIPGSGKTTLATKVVRGLNAHHRSEDIDIDIAAMIPMVIHPPHTSGRNHHTYMQ